MAAATTHVLYVPVLPALHLAFQLRLSPHSPAPAWLQLQGRWHVAVDTSRWDANKKQYSYTSVSEGIGSATC